MIPVKRGDPPVELVQCLHKLLPEQRTYVSLPTEVKSALKETLLQRQGYLCAYCMRRIDSADHAKLEHVIPQSRSIAEGHPEQTVEYRNMLVTCMGGDDEGRPYSEKTCDSHKADMPIAIDPTSETDIATIRYLRNGMIHSSNLQFDHDLCDTLNLNCDASFLPQDRRGAYRAMERAIARENPKTHKAKQQFARRKLVALEQAEKKEAFVGVMYYVLKRWAA